MKNEKNTSVGKKCGKKTEKQENYITEFRHNIEREMAQRDWTIRETAEQSDMSFETLKNFLYDKEAKDCRLSTAIKLARAFGVGIDELVSAGTYKDEAIKYIKMYRDLPDSSKALINWHVQEQTFLHTAHSHEKYINIMNPVCINNGNLKKTNDYDQMNIANIGEELLHKVFFGIRIPCDHYLPHYLRGDVLLIANDRDPMRGENSIVIINGNIVITKRVVENGIEKYYGIRDGHFRVQDPDHANVIGYIAKVISE